MLNPLVIKLFVRKGKLLLDPRNLLKQFSLVEGLLGHDLPTQVLDLGIEALLDRRVLLAHDFSPD